MKQYAFQPKKGNKHPPVYSTMEIYQEDHRELTVPQYTDKAVEEGHDWVTFTRL